jgi:nucleotide-binding universal stress UspA family protein
MYTVLMAVDQSVPRTMSQVDAVLDIAEGTDVEAHLFHDFTENPEGASVTQVNAVREAADRLDEAGVAVEFHEASGDPANTIVELADELDVDAITVGSRKRTPTGKVLFGSVTQSVLLGTDRPVIVCGGDDGE